MIYIVVPLALLLAGAFLAAFLWSVRKGQFDDMDSPAVRMLFDDDDRVRPDATEKATEDAESRSRP
ncbi:Cytochrome oxidase maturation protein cbb3-type [Planctomycetes bacterium Pla163]|uniref:Cytochrome oxidase maturation protein cbb3-type n=1 Tax=Rohdeia mirabilis TaxID=2528008 RepID=A0A518CY24_9BACT|nr:Cytochrome oxidase maturation protein cbb3-type [Planctomycetes bacterium Pla163]